MTEIEIADGIADLPRAEWDALVADGSPFLEWDWLASLEASGAVGGDTGWTPRPLIARRGGRLVAACPLYVKANSEGEFVFDFAWADAALRSGIRYYPKLLVGVPFTPVAGQRILTAAGEDRAAWLRRFGEALRETCLAAGLSSVHVNFCPPEDLAPLEQAGFVRRLGIQYQWRNEGYASFDDFLGRFRSKRRNQIRRERRDVRTSGVRIEILDGDDIPDELFPTMHRIYRSTVDAYLWGRPYLNERFFALLRERLRRRLSFVVARQDGAVVAGAVNVRKGSVLYGRYWGALRPVRHLHFDVCYYTAVEHCIAQGLERFEPGAGGEFKQVRGFDPQLTYSAHFVAEPRLARAIALHLETERHQVERGLDWIRAQSALKREVD
ncbi:MAG: GNAT family N-acetyltransferase [Deltaproteobacteria bacterium]|nr:GNAT family N-acetyltransferase [Deltaproteobacteria bacterium]